MFKNIKQPQSYQPSYRPANNYSKPEFREKPYVPKIDNSSKVDRIMSTILSGDINAIKNTLAAENMHLNIKNSMGKSPIHVLLEQTSLSISEQQKLNIIKFLATNGASLTSYDNDNVTPLHLAAKNMLPLIVQYLIANGAKIDAMDNNGMTPLHYAVQGMPEKCIPKNETKTRATSDVKSLMNQLTLEIIEILKQNNRYLMDIQQYVNNYVASKSTNIQNLYIKSVQDKTSPSVFKNDVLNLMTSQLQVLTNLTIMPYNQKPLGSPDTTGVLPERTSANDTNDDKLIDIKYNQILLVLAYYQQNDTDIKNAFINDYSQEVFDATVAKITDQLLIIYINGIIQSATFRLISGFANSAPQYSNLLMNILIVDTQYEKKLQGIYDDMLDKYYNQNVNQVQEILYDNKEHIYTWPNNNMTSDIEPICYAIDQSVIKMLANLQTVDKPDNNGMTPVYYAIQNMHISTIDTLLQSGASMKNIRNYDKVTPIEFLTKKCNNLTQSSVTEVLNTVAKPYTIEMFNELDNIVVPYLDIIFPKLIIMFNNFLFFTTKSYINDWSYEDNQKLDQLLKSNNIDTNNIIPLLENIDPNVANSSIRVAQLNRSSSTNANKIDNNIKELDKILFTIGNIEKEINANNDANIKNQYIDKINKLESRISNLVINDKQFIGTNIDNLKKGIIIKLSRKYNQLKAKYPFVKPSDSEHTLFEQVGTIQDDIFNEVSRTKIDFSDALLYNGLWKSYINDEVRLRNKYNIHLVSKIIPNKNQLKDLFVKIFAPVCSDLFELEQYVDPQTNWVLSEVVNIITHIVRSVLSSNLYYAIVRLLVQYIGGRSGGTNDQIINIVNSIIVDTNLRNYVYQTMPAIAVRSILKIPYSEYEDTQIYDIQKLFDAIVVGLKQNKEVPVLDQSSLMTELQTNTIPYYTRLFTIAITKMKTCVDNYAKQILEESKCMDIMDLLNKAQN